MSQPDFPTFDPAQQPEHDTFRREPAYNPCLSPEFEGGAETSRSRHTRVPWHWTFHYRAMTTANKETLMGFWRVTCKCGETVFHWTDPTNSVAYFVRFRAQPQAELEGDGTGTWKVTLQLREALGSYT